MFVRVAVILLQSIEKLRFFSNVTFILDTRQREVKDFSLIRDRGYCDENLFVFVLLL